MKTQLFNFRSIPVNLQWTFLLLFLFLDMTSVLVIFGSVLLHEMGHAYVADKIGYRVNSINLDIFYGSAEIDISHIHERDSLKIVLGGPIVNIVLFLLAYMTHKMGMQSDLITKIYTINFILAVFNLIPVYPLDGGRIVRDILLIYNRSNAIFISSLISLVVSISCAIIFAANGYILSVLFFGLFAYYAIRDLKSVK